MSTYVVVIYGWSCDYGACSEAWEDADGRGRPSAWRRLRAFGWRQRKGKHYCPAHSGANNGR